MKSKIKSSNKKNNKTHKKNRKISKNIKGGGNPEYLAKLWRINDNTYGAEVTIEKSVS